MALTRERCETFEVFDDHLVREVVPSWGEPYRHRCPRTAFEQVAHAVDEFGSDGFTLKTLVEREALPFTQVAVALAYFKERGIVATRCRRNYAATGSVHLDAMTEYYALAANA